MGMHVQDEYPGGGQAGVFLEHIIIIIFDFFLNIQIVMLKQIRPNYKNV